MKKLFSKSEEKSEMTETEAIQYQTYRFSNNVSMKETGNSIDGIYRGIEFKPYQGIKGTHLFIIHFEKDGEDITCVAGSEVLKFLKNFTIGYYLHIERIDTKLTKEGNKYAQYQFKFNSLGVKTPESFRLLDCSELPEKLIVAKTELPQKMISDKTDTTD